MQNKARRTKNKIFCRRALGRAAMRITRRDDVLMNDTTLDDGGAVFLDGEDIAIGGYGFMHGKDVVLVGLRDIIHFYLTHRQFVQLGYRISIENKAHILDVVAMTAVIDVGRAYGYAIRLRKIAVIYLVESYLALRLFRNKSIVYTHR